jgi:hypothetical protein
MTKGPRDRGPGEKGKGTTTKATPSLRLVSAQADGDSGGDSRDRAETEGGPVLAGELIRPGRRPKTRGPVLPNLGVTAKEEAFAQLVAKGMTLTDAYRNSHDPEGMQDNSVWHQATKVGSRDRVRNRIDQLIEQGQGSALHDRRKALAWALERLQREAETAETDGARVAAVSLIMRHHALLTDRQEVEATDSRDSAAIETELRQRLEKLLKPTG